MFSKYTMLFLICYTPMSLRYGSLLLVFIQMSIVLATFIVLDLKKFFSGDEDKVIKFSDILSALLILFAVGVWIHSLIMEKALLPV